ncbi:MAG: DUF3883 domain-containing protein [Proteobacteria bacterium]|nr:DUF3883 domain-containing protein [Pseudomonadota bacterium]
MQNEVNPVVFKVVDDIRANSPKLGITEVIKRMGVREASERRADYVWQLPGGGFLLTIWSEFVHVHANGRWFYVETLDTKTRLGGGARSHVQQVRAEARVTALRQMHGRSQDCAAVLQINRVPIAELEQNKNAEVGIRVKDPERWHVARWDAGRDRAILVRGATGWAPSDAEVDEHLARRRMDGVLNVQVQDSGATADSPPAEPPSPSPSPTEPRLWFPDQEHRDAVEAASMAHMTAFYKAQGLVVHDVSDKCLGYDLRVEDAGATPRYLVEVKGTSMPTEGFFISRNERRCAEREPAWCLAIVTNALTVPSERIYSAADMEELFGFEPLVWRCEAKPRQ